MNWNEYEKLILNQIKEAKELEAHAEKEYKQAKSKREGLERQYDSFNHEIRNLLGGD